MRLSAAPTCPTSVCGSASGSATRTGSATSPLSSGRWATSRGGGGHPAQRAQRAADDQAPTAVATASSGGRSTTAKINATRSSVASTTLMLSPITSVSPVRLLYSDTTR